MKAANIPPAYPRVFIIAEAGVNHNGDMEMAQELIRVAKRAGADAIKFQTFKAEALVSKNAPKANYQNLTTDNGESQFDMLKRLELTAEDHWTLMDACDKEGIEFLSTPFDLTSLDFLFSDLQLGQLKLSSGEVTNGPLLLAAANTGLPIILSTGMATMDELEHALAVLAFGMCSNGFPEWADARAAYESIEGRQALESRVRLLHCTSEYPAPINEINLKAMQAMRAAFALPVGLSDHSEDIVVPIAAAALGACIVEKHFTLDQLLPGPDHKASITPEKLVQMVAGIRQVEAALGSGCKEPTDAELRNRQTIRKSIVAERDINIGEAFTSKNLSIKRPGSGVSPMFYWDMLKTTARRSYKAGELIDP